jgi:hypothetical protein
MRKPAYLCTAAPLVAALFLGVISLAACGGCDDPLGSGGGGLFGGGDDNGSDGPNAVKSLTITPGQVTLITDGATPATQAFDVTATENDGDERAVTDEVAFTLSRPNLGSMSGAVFSTVGIGGVVELEAELDGQTDTAEIEIRVQTDVILDPPPGQDPVPPTVSDLFDNAEENDARAPTLVYPNDGVMLPPNLGQMEIHWWRGHDDNTLYEVSFESAYVQVRLYTRCTPLNGGCLLAVDENTWHYIAETQAGRGSLQLGLRATDDQGTQVGTAAQLQIYFAANHVEGGLYYWTTSNGTGIMRVDFAGTQQVPERFFPFSGSRCYGCHALSPDGKKMSLSERGQNNGQLWLIDIGTREILVDGPDDKREQFQTWAPTSDRFAGIYGDGNGFDPNAIRIRNGDTGEVESTIQFDFEVDHPDWSKDGSRLLMSKVTHHQTSQRPGRAGIGYIEEVGADAWTDYIELIPPEDGKNFYYPAYSPEGTFFVYNESICPGGEIYDWDCDADADPSARLWAMDNNGGQAIELANANAPGVNDNGQTELTNTFPRWAPFVDPLTAEGGGEVVWMTFSSRRNYGLREPVDTNQLLWMVAVDPAKIRNGEDGSFAAFFLPFQDLTTSNHIAQWTEVVVPIDDPPGGGEDGGPGNNGGSDGGTGGGNNGGNNQCLGATESCDPNDPSAQCCVGLFCVEVGDGQGQCLPIEG